MNIAYYNNEFCVDRNVISIYNGSFLYGINIFEGIRAYRNSDKEKINIFGLDEHLERLYVSGNFVGFSMPITKERLKNELYNIFETHSICENVYIRITFFIAGETSWAESDKIDYIISVRSMTSNIIENNSMKLSISNFNRISSRALPPSVKAGANYLNSRYAHLQAKRNGYDGALLINDKGFVSESTGACVFFIKDNTLYTPSVNNDILVGVTRNKIIELCEKININVQETDITPSLLYTFNACFLAGTMIEIKPVSQIENKIFDNENNVLFSQIKNELYEYVYQIEV